MASFLFIGHEASLTGAPYTQLHIIQWLRTNTPHKVELVLLQGGALLPEFEKVATVYVLQKFSSNPPLGQRLLRKLDALTGRYLRGIYSRIKKSNPQFILANSLLSLSFAVEAKQQLGIPLLLHLHELQTPFFHISQEKYVQNSRHVDFFIACSEAVRTFHQTICGLTDEQIATVYSFFGPRPHDETTAASVRAELNIPPQACLVGAVGSQGWGKGADWFLQVAQYFVGDDTRNVYFVWVGGHTHSRDYKEFRYDLKLLGLADRVITIPSRPHIIGFYQAFDVLLLTSRIDSFPLVCLEAAMQGCPTVCFDQAGGMPEFVRDDAGIVVPYGDTVAMAKKTAYLLDNDSERQQMGQTGRQRVLTNHTIEVAGPQFYHLFQQFIRCE